MARESVSLFHQTARIAADSQVSYKGKFNLATIVYLHRISDNRMPGSVLMNLRVFAGMCGQNAMPNVILATTMWDLVEEQVGNAREQQLKRDCWRDMIVDGCRTERFDGTYDSAWRILDSLRQKNRAPVLLSTEIVDTHLRLNETSAGVILNKKLQKLIAEQKEAARKLRKHAGDQANEKIVRGPNERKAEIEKRIRQTGDQVNLNRSYLLAGGRLGKFFLSPGVLLVF
jgi:hypothetical protein